jgi:hypothetical protein
MDEYPQFAIIAVVDMEGSSSRSDMAKRRARKEMYGWLERTLGPEWSRCTREDRGDGVLMIWPLAVPDPVPPKVAVSRLLRLPETADGHPERPRLRVSVHIGQAFRDEEGFSGASIDETFRLNDGGVLKAALAEARGPVAYLLSEDVHKAVVRYGYDGLAPSGFHPTVVRVKESTLEAWLHVPAEDELAARLAAEGARPPARPADRETERDTDRGADRPGGRTQQADSGGVNVDGNFRNSTIYVSGRDLNL